MSKEMTPKEALQIIQDNITPRTLGILTVEFNIVEQALDRLEQLEIENRNNEKVIADGVKLINRNLELQSRLESLEIENDELLDKKLELVVKNKQQDMFIEKLIQENEKLKNVIEIIKSKNVDIFFLRNNSEFDLEKYNYEIKNNNMQYCYKDCLPLTQEENDLLKEVFEL